MRYGSAYATPGTITLHRQVLEHIVDDRQVRAATPSQVRAATHSQVRAATHSQVLWWSLVVSRHHHAVPLKGIHPPARPLLHPE